LRYMNIKPDCIMIGAQKAGTTSLADLLSQHPSICLPTPKEPDFFTRFYSNGFDWYKEKFECINKEFLIDASTSYSMCPLDTSSKDNPLIGVPERIHQCNPDVKFIYVLRNPIARTYSSYWHAVRAGDESRSIKEALSQESLYVRASLYDYQLSKYLEYFSLDSFVFILFEDLIKNPQNVCERCFNFLDLEHKDFSVTPISAKNQSFQWSNSGSYLNKILPNRQLLKRVTQTAKAILPETAIEKIKGRLTEKVPPISDEEKSFLSNYFSESIVNMEQMANLNLASWKNK